MTDLVGGRELSILSSLESSALERRALGSNTVDGDGEDGEPPTPATLNVQLTHLQVAHLIVVLDQAIARAGRMTPTDHLATIRDHIRSQATNFVEDPTNRAHSALVTYQQAADRLNVSHSTVRRLVASGRLDLRGRRITTTSIDTYLKGT